MEVAMQVMRSGGQRRYRFRGFLPWNLEMARMRTSQAELGMKGFQEDSWPEFECMSAETMLPSISSLAPA